jgi:hypothetical protein
VNEKHKPRRMRAICMYRGARSYRNSELRLSYLIGNKGRSCVTLATLRTCSYMVTGPELRCPSCARVG